MKMVGCVYVVYEDDVQRLPADTQWPQRVQHVVVERSAVRHWRGTSCRRDAPASDAVLAARLSYSQWGEQYL